MRARSNLRCNFCSFIAPKSSVLQIHIRQHVGEKPFQCSHCSSSFVSNRALTVHITRKHATDRPFPCSYSGCEKRFKTKSELAAHSERMHKRLRPFKCSDCSKLFYSSSGLNNHFLRLHTPNNKLFECNQCEHKTSTASDLKRHTEGRHTTYQNLKCDPCGSLHKNGMSWKQHMRKYHRNISKTKTLFKCREPNCFKEYTSSGTLHYHQVKEHRGGVKPFSCSICPYSAIDPNSLTIHMRIHTGERPYTCDECERCFVTSGQLRSHKAHVHSDLRPFNCRFCPYKGKTQDGLKRHERTHNPDAFKQLECSMCDYKCNNKRRLQEHHMTHQQEKPFNCEQCNYKSKTKRHLREHQRIHSAEKPFKCPECDFRCRHKSSLFNHLVIHSNLKPFNCLADNCKSTFKRKVELKTHLKLVHKTKDKFKCTFCPEVFYQEEDFQEHTQDHIRKEHKRDTGVSASAKALSTKVVGPSTESAIRPCFVLLKRLNVILL